MRETHRSAGRRRTARGLRQEALEHRSLLAAVRADAGFLANSMDRIDEGSTSAIDLTFSVNFFGTTHNQLFINNNGNVTFVSPLADGTSSGLDDAERPTIAPFFADVDTRNSSSGVVTYGTATVDGRRAMGVNWIDVAGYELNAQPTNSFQLVLIDRSDVEAGAFDIEFNYDRIAWDSGVPRALPATPVGQVGNPPARAGFSAGTGVPGTYYELIGSGSAGAFLDSNTATSLSTHRFNSDTLGRYLFQVRNGTMLDAFGLAGQAVQVAPNILYHGVGINPLDVQVERPTNAGAIDTSNAEPIKTGGSTGLDLDGSGITVAVIEANVPLDIGTVTTGGHSVRTSHTALAGRTTTPGEAPTVFSEHATQVAGTIAAADSRPEAAGFAPAATIQSFAIQTGFGLKDNQVDGIDITNHAYSYVGGWDVGSEDLNRNGRLDPLEDLNTNGQIDSVSVWLSDRTRFDQEDPRFGLYSVTSSAVDDFLFRNQGILSVFAAGNEGDDRFQNSTGTNQYRTYFSAGLAGGQPGWYTVPNVTTTVAPGDDGNGGNKATYNTFDNLPWGGQTSKNALVVGAVRDVPLELEDAGYLASIQGTQANFSDGFVAPFSSWGPTDDGRMGVDLVANGTTIVTTSGRSDSDYTFDEDRNANLQLDTGEDTDGDGRLDTAVNGTSFAAASVSGIAALLYQQFDELGSANLPVQARTAATIKGALLHSAIDAYTPGPDYRTGFGLANARGAANFLNRASRADDDRIHTGTLTPAQTSASAIQISMEEGRQFKATLVWTDPAGNGIPANSAAPFDSSFSNLFNDLNLVVRSPSGQEFLPWVLDPTQPSAGATRGENHRDNVEQVMFVVPETGVYTLEISTPEVEEGVQNFSLLTSLSGETPDRFEVNDTFDQATVLGSEPEVTLQDLTLHQTSDIDYFKYTANRTGTLVLNAHFDTAAGDLQVEVRDSHDRVISTSAAQGDTERIVVPVVGQESYWIRITSLDGSVTDYDLEIENFAVAPPLSIDLPAVDRNRTLNDTGSSQTDNITSRLQPEIIIQADVTQLVQAGLTPLTPVQATARNLPGFAIEVFVHGNSVGFAEPIANSNGLFRFTFSANQLPVEVTPADNGGWLHYIQAAVRIVDGQLNAAGQPDPASDRSPLSPVLELVTDTAPPTVSAPDLVAASDSGISSSDNITSLRTPTFEGTATFNSRVRLYANGQLVGESVAGTEGTDSAEQTGRWRITSGSLEYGRYQFAVEAEDAAGNIQRSTPVTVVIDPFEPNDVIGQATVLGSEEKITLNGLILHQAEEIDLFQYTAAHTGTVLMQVFSADALNVRVRDVRGNLIATASAETVATGRSRYHVTLPVVGQEFYYLEVTYAGPPPTDANDSSLANYEIEIENFAAPVPDLVDLPDANENNQLNDTGSDEFDDVTVRTTPEILIQADLAELAASGIAILSPTATGLETATGVAIEILVNGNSVGFATEVPDSGHTLFRYTFRAGQLPQDALHATSQGWLHFVTAAVRVFDGQRNAQNQLDPAEARSPLSPPLRLLVDTTAPALSAPDLIASSDTGQFADDNVTSVRTPTFQGTGEHLAAVRIFAAPVQADGSVGPRSLVGHGQVGTQADNNDTAQTGIWQVTVGALDDGVYEITAESEDRAGNRQLSSTLRIEIDATAPNWAFLDLVESSDTGRHNDDDRTNDAQPDVTMTTHDDQTALHALLHADFLRLRVFDRFESAAGVAEFVLYDSSRDAAIEAVSTVNDFFTSRTFVQTSLAAQFFTLFGANGAVRDAGGSGALADGIHNLKLVVEDRAGNVTDDEPFRLEIDTTAFAGQAQLDPASDTGVAGFPETFADRITCDPTPAFFGTAEANAIVTVSIDGVPAGTIVAIPLDGDDGFQPPNTPYEQVQANWRFESPIGLSNGMHTAVFTFEDPAGNRAAAPQSVTFFIDCIGPRITNITRGDVSVDGQFTMNENTTSLFKPQPLGGPDPLVSSIVVHFSDLPPRVTEFNYPAILQALAEEEGNYTLTGDGGGNISILQAIATITTPTDGQSAARMTVELVVHDLGPDGQLFTADDRGSPLPDDRFTLTVSDRLADQAGNPLDGESNAQAPFAGQDAPRSTPPTFPTGDGQPGGPFAARFTIDSRPEIGIWSAGSVYLDINGNFYFDPTNVDQVNRDLIHSYGLTSDFLFSGNFRDGTQADGFDKVAAYGNVNGAFRWLLDADNDVVPDLIQSDPSAIIGSPVSGDFDPTRDGDEIALFSGSQWFFDTSGSFTVLGGRPTDMSGYPVAGDFDRDGVEDLATWDVRDNRFQLSLSGRGQGVVNPLTSVSFTLDAGFPFIGVRERPVAADMDGDGFDDLGLWVPDRGGSTPDELGEWYFLVSHGQSIVNRINGQGAIKFTSAPFGHDLFAQFGNEFGEPIVGNFDPPWLAAAREEDSLANTTANTASAASVAAQPVGTANANASSSETPATPVLASATDASTIDSFDARDVNRDGQITPRDALAVLNELNTSTRTAGEIRAEGDRQPLDVSQDGLISPRDALLVLSELQRVAAENQTLAALAATTNSTTIPTANTSSSLNGLAVDSVFAAHAPTSPTLRAFDRTAKVTSATEIIVRVAPDQGPLPDGWTVQIVAGPAHGRALVDAQGQIRYQSDTKYVGEDVILYAIEDGQRRRVSARLAVSVADQRN